MAKLSVAVLFGGISSEHEVSLLSAASVIENLDAAQFEVFPVGITKSGKWLYLPGSVDQIRDGSWENDPYTVPAFISPDRLVNGLVFMPEDGNCFVRKIDVAFPVLHGKLGEDGTMQGLLEIAGIPYVGCDTLASAVCMDKEITNTLLDHNGIPHTPWAVMLKNEIDDFFLHSKRWEETFGYPMFVKPANAGSSVGVSKAENRESLKEALILAFEHDKKAIVEKAVSGLELECAVLGNDLLESSVVSEIVPKNAFYDYAAKYQTPSETHLPARINEKLSNDLRAMAMTAFRILGCSGMARVDFLFESETGTLYLNELNTIPGFTSISMYPKMMTYSGIPYPLLLNRLIELALERHPESLR